jgi:hypothetical protein
MLVENNDNNQWQQVPIQQVYEKDGEKNIYYGFPAFNGISGPILPNNIGDTPFDYFTQFFDNDVMDMLVTNTNSFGSRTLPNDWIDTDINELYLFFAVIMYMGLIKLNQRRDYWADPLINQSFVNERMTYSRFTELIKCIHVKDLVLDDRELEKMNNKDPFWSIKPLERKIAEKCRNLFNPEQFISIDEQCLPFKGRHKAKQYNKNKPNKWHLKLYCMNCSKTGYLLNFYFYRGSREKRPVNITSSNYPAWKLTKNNNYHNKQHILITDNYFTSSTSINNMLQRQIHTIGTMREKKLNDAKQLAFKKNSKKVKRGKMKQYFNNANNIYLVTWKDTKVVNFFSTIISRYHKIKRRGVEGQLIINAPTIGEVYNKNMGGTDLFDQVIQYYWPKIRSASWKPRCIMHMLYISIINSHVLFKKSNELERGDVNFELISYIKLLITNLSTQVLPPENFNIRMKRRHEQLVSDPNRMIGIHSPQLNSTSRAVNGENIRKEARRLCANCKINRVLTMCINCNVGLCIYNGSGRNCWKEFHSADFR